MPVRERRTPLHTILLIGEGTTEKAFLLHLKSLYVIRGCGIKATIRTAHGKGPDHVVRHTARVCRNASFDQVVVLLDTDIEMSATIKRKAKSNKIRVIGSTPCFEGLLLRILGEHVPSTSKQCKAQMGKKLPERLTRQEDYQSKFSRELLDARRDDVPELGALLDCLLFD